MTYPNLRNNYIDISYLKQRAILASKNIDVDELNSIMLSMLPGELRVLNSADKLCPSEFDSTKQHAYPPKFLHSLKLPGLPNHSLELKVGAPIMLLRNINQSLGLCNGTRLIVHKIRERVIETKVITGSNVDETVFIPRVVLSPSANQSPFQMKRRQFSGKVSICYDYQQKSRANSQ